MYVFATRSAALPACFTAARSLSLAVKIDLQTSGGKSPFWESGGNPVPPPRINTATSSITTNNPAAAAPISSPFCLRLVTFRSSNASSPASPPPACVTDTGCQRTSVGGNAVATCSFSSRVSKICDVSAISTTGLSPSTTAPLKSLSRPSSRVCLSCPTLSAIRRKLSLWPDRFTPVSERSHGSLRARSLSSTADCTASTLSLKPAIKPFSSRSTSGCSVRRLETSASSSSSRLRNVFHTAGWFFSWFFTARASIHRTVRSSAVD